MAPRSVFFFFAVINAVSRRYFLQADDVTDMKDWVAALNKASKITVSYTHTHTSWAHVTVIAFSLTCKLKQEAAQFTLSFTSSLIERLRIGHVN